MSKKGLKSMKDENQDLQKQIGCISGFFQMFDRHRFLTGQTNSHNNIPNQGDSIKELNNGTQKGKNVKVARENQQSLTESSSGTSMFSSSCSSSMSSLEFNRTIQIEPPPSITQVKIHENSSSEIAVKQCDNERRESLDFHDIVKDSMRMDSQRLSVKTLAKQEKKCRILKNVDSPRPMTAWDSPRLSYDGRDIQSTLKSATKFKELPRLSLDSKERSIKSFNEGTKPRNLLKGPQKACGGSIAIGKQTEEPESAKRPSSVVAKLMGIEAFPEWSETCDSCNTDKNETFVGSRKDGSITNVSPYSQFSKISETSTKASNRSFSVYGEIEKRMADLEFKKSGKDLRALKQILEAMHRYKESLDTTSDQASNSPYDNRSNSSVNESLSVQSPRTRPKNPTTVVERSNSTQSCKSPIVIMKPAKVARKTNSSSSTESSIHSKSSNSKVYRGDATNVKDPRDKSNKITSKLIQSSKVPRVVIAENNTSSSMMVETRSPRLQKKFGLERRSPPTSPSSDISGNRRHQNKQSSELSSPSKISRQKFSTSKERNENLSEISYQRRDFKQVEAVSSGDIKDSSKENFMAETKVTAEQPSPVSVLDATFYREDPPSPVKRKSDISKDLEEVLNACGISEEDSEDVALSSNTNTKVVFCNGTNDIDLITNNLVLVLQQFDHSDDKRFKNFSDHEDPDRKYISEILLASGRLTSPGSCKALHLSGYPVNPMLFLALEKMKTNTNFNVSQMNNTQEKMQRKLVFDVVNEILFQKLLRESSYKPYYPEGRKPEGQHLLDMLCTEIDKLQRNNKNVGLSNEDEYLTNIVSEDLVQHPTATECYNEIPNLVLDIERLIFKDLITDVVRSE